MIDLRSDTVTKPSPAMRQAIANAEVGDDVFKEDPTVLELETYGAQLFGKEAALFCSSGTQTNQIAINVHVQPGGEVICHEESHIYKYEGGGIAKNSGASVRLLPGDRGRINAASIANWMNPSHDVHFPLTQLVSIEDTANRGGGAVYEVDQIAQISQLCKELNLPLHLDGARVFNALAVNGLDPANYGAFYDSISICLSKGLGSPVGSLLLGSAAFIEKARRVRKVFGGGMRQAGMIAAGGLYALQNNVQRLHIDHQHAKQLEQALTSCSYIASVVPVQTNIVVANLQDPERRDVFIELLKVKGIACMAFGPGMIRMVTHLDISNEDIDYCVETLLKL
ncbi:MAG: aminotransferase class I/II-fold pyridoxal phosphate-dependent enzyme [Sphingomonadales bacterium]|nr:aminotransferase class I/II-fold pyridoxal phosphate-dependent enzyme [Sphingomonadales bacterium]